MKLKIFANDGMFLTCHIAKNSSLKNYYENYKKVGRTARIKKQVRQMLKIEKLSQKWSFERQDEDYLYYDHENTRYKFNKHFWKV